MNAMQLNNSDKKFLNNLLIALVLLRKNVKEHRESYEYERKRCKDANEDFIVPADILGALTKSVNEIDKNIGIMESKLKDVDFRVGNQETKVSKIIDEIYNQIKLENGRESKRGAVVVSVDEEKDTPWLPPLFLDRWLAAWFTYKYMFEKLGKTIKKMELDTKKMENAIKKYNKFFCKEILVIKGDVI